MPEKSTKTAVHYRRGDGDHQCSECSMFRAPHRCTAVTGYIRPVDLCDLFERKQDYADGGLVYSGGSDEGEISEKGLPYGKHKLDLTIPLASDTDLTGRVSAAPNFYGPDRHDLGARIGIGKRFADGGRASAAFTVPADVIKKLGSGDPLKGYAVLRDAFGIEPSEPLGQIPADTIAAIGGRQVLQKFVAKVRSQARPLPGKTLLISGQHGAAAINVSRK